MLDSAGSGGRGSWPDWYPEVIFEEIALDPLRGSRALRKSQETIGPGEDIPATTEFNAVPEAEE